ncbi:MAG: thioredoxin domain-containing protein [Flavobacteriaceae bacterium]|nr:thioredoxin domain-containing protein [Flavobacteriaceae bacterium]
MRFLIILFCSCFFFIGCAKKTKPMPKHQYTNSLINESSPYLLQHAHNPVDWYPWGKEALERAKKENKLILISIGYAACHWCHVMEHESFEDTAVAKIMNQNFINIKIDREERPDIDQIYMNAVQLMTGRGGWPLNCIALPDGRPVWGGTYFPKENWIDALHQINKVYREDPEKVEAYAEKLTAGVRQSDLITLNTDAPRFEKVELDSIITKWKSNLDFTLGGNNGAPKFPLPNNLTFLLRYAKQSGDNQIDDYVQNTLHKMAMGGLYDQVGGGFARYSVDAKWHIPHFEKMLYDNAQLVSLYSNAYLADQNDFYKEVVYETLRFVERELYDNSGGFYSSLDADSTNENGELEEGAYYVWSEDELTALLPDDFNIFKDYYNISDEWKWEHQNFNLHRTKSNEEIATIHGISEEALVEKVNLWKNILLKQREKRSRPRLDDKILTSWNALMLKGYAEAYKVFNDQHFLEKALLNGNFIINNQLREDGGLYRNYKNGKSSINAYLEDYATTIDAFLQLYQVTLDKQWLHTAKQLTDYCYDHFYDEKSAMFFFTSDEDEALIARKIDTDDNVISSSNSIMANNLFLLGHYFSNKKYADNALQMLQNVKNRATVYPGGSSNWLNLYLNYLGEFYEVAISGEKAHEKLKELNSAFIPNKLIVGSTKDSDLPLLKNKFTESQTMIYVCINGTCKLPVAKTEDAIKQIKTNL